MKNLIIDKRAIKANLQVVKDRTDGSAIYADLSGDAYGLGLLETARLLRDEGVRSFIVSEVKDAALLRDSGFHEERIMMLRSTADSEELSKLIDLNVICTVGSYDAAVALNGIAESRSTICEVQIKIDTGLGRYGFMPAETDKIAAIYRYMPNLAIVGMFTSFSESWRSKKITLAQLDAFEDVMDKLMNLGYDVGITHACDSAAIFRYDFGRMDAVRPGHAFSGRVPGSGIPSLHKVGYIKAGIEEVGWFPKGHRLAGGVTLKKPTKLAVISVGYYHGFGVINPEEDRRFLDFFRNRRRRLSVKVNGQRAFVLGAVGMNHTIVDVSKIDCTVGDTVIMDVDPINVKGLPRIYKTE